MTLSTPEAPPISVLLSCYNSERWLGEAIESVLSQTFEDFEFVIVDDGSTDRSSEIIRAFAERDKRIIVVTKDNTGLADSLNVGIRISRGKWIARIDADDICEPTRLELQLAAARKDKRLVFVGSGLSEIDEIGRTHGIWRYPKNHQRLVRNLTSGRRFPPHSSAFYRADVVRSIGGYRKRIQRAEDRDLWLRLADIGRLAALEAPLVRVRKHAAQISHDESGMRQRIDSAVGTVSYWIRRYRHEDPVESSEEDFDIFWKFVASRLEHEGAFERSNYIAQAKALIRSSRQLHYGWFKVAQHLSRRPYLLLRHMRVRVLGDPTLRLLAIQWIRHAGKRDTLTESNR